MSEDELINATTKKTLMNYLVSASWVLLVLSIGLGVVVLGYCLLFFPSHSPCLAHRSVHSVLLFLVVLTGYLYFIKAKRESETLSGYWGREENIVLGEKINNLIWHLFPCIPILYYSIILMQHMSAEHSHFLLACTPSYVERFLPLVGWLLIVILLNYLILAIVKRCREQRSQQKPE